MKPDCDNAEVLRRLTIIEGALGLDLDMSACSGDPMNCSVTPCTPATCPLAQNRLQELAREVGTMKEEARLLRHLLAETARAVPPTVLRAAELAAQQEKLGALIAQAEQDSASLGPGPMRDGFVAWLDTKKQALEALGRELAALRDT